MLAIIIAAIAIFAFGALWFTVLFGRKWSQLMDFGPNSQAMNKDMGMVKPMIINFILNIVLVWAISYLVPALLTVTYSEFLKTLVVIWLGFSFTIYANAAVWERKSWTLVAINATQSLIALVIASAVVYYMQ